MFMKQPKGLMKKRCRPKFEEVFICWEISNRIISMSMTDRVQIQSVTAALSYERF